MNRLNKELSDIQHDNIFQVKVDDNNNKIWYVTIKGIENTLYANETYTLQFKFPDNYVNIIK